MATISTVEVRAFNVPLAEVLSDAKHGDHTHFELVTVTIRTDEGHEGTGYTYTGGKGGQAIKAMVEHDLAPFLIGQEASAVEALYDAMQWHIHYVGRGGIASFAISAVDIALWDIRCKAAGQPLWQMAGGTSDRCKAYCGGIDLNFPLEKLVAQTEGYLAAGFNAVKIKVGQPRLETDLERAARIRKVLGPDRAFMVDANYALSVDQAIEAARGFAEFDILWFEEPTIPDDYLGYGRIAEETGVPWPWAKTSTRSTNSNTPSATPASASSSPMPRTAAASRAGCRWRNCPRNTAYPCAAMGCRNFRSRLCRRAPMPDGLKFTAFRLINTRHVPLSSKTPLPWHRTRPVLVLASNGKNSKPPMRRIMQRPDR